MRRKDTKKEWIALLSASAFYERFSVFCALVFVEQGSGSPLLQKNGFQFLDFFIGKTHLFV